SSKIGGYHRYLRDRITRTRGGVVRCALPWCLEDISGIWVCRSNAECPGWSFISRDVCCITWQPGVVEMPRLWQTAESTHYGLMCAPSTGNYSSLKAHCRGWLYSETDDEDVTMSSGQRL
ncbi:hypothetical protein PV325_007078, partial [Microctonus aethiopoides]